MCKSSVTEISEIMKQIISTVILIFAVCLTVSAQANANVNTAPKRTLTLLNSFNDSDSEWYKLTMDILGRELTNNPSSTGFIRIRNGKNFWRRLYFVRLGLKFYEMDLSRINLLIADEQEHDTDILILPHNAEPPAFENCVVIRTTDIDKIEKLFRPKLVTKKRKRH